MIARKKQQKVQLPTVERDVSWMYFNHRILQEAQRNNVPLLERISFLGIYSNNLDEFFRVRVATLSRIAEARNRTLAAEVEKARQTIKQINRLNSAYSKEYTTTVAQTTALLREQGICILNDQEVSPEQTAFIHQYYYNKLNGITNPVWLKEVEDLSSDNDDVIYMAVRMTRWREGGKRPVRNYAVVKVPVDKLGRFLQLPDNEGRSYLMYMDDVVRCCLPMIFVGVQYDHFEAYAFKFTKDAEMEMDNDLDGGKMQKVQKGVKSRKRGEPMRVIYDEQMPKDLLKNLMNRLCLDRLDTAQAGGRYHNHKDLMGFPDCGRTDLKYPRWEPIPLQAFNTTESVLHLIQQRDYMLHVPYQSFDAYIRLLREAAINPEVKAIKTTLYRLAKGSRVIEALITAAKNKKHVTVVIELLARFDEASNISWSKKMMDAGVHVIFGIEGLKVHSKITHIEMRSGNIACIGTGNFHEGNARVYTDCLLFTASKTLVKEVANVFEFIKTPFVPVKFKELLVSPNDMKTHILRMITNEIANHRLGKPAYIRIKMNHITDTALIKRLYAASAEGVQIDIVLRGNSSLVTGVPGLSDNIRIHGIIDRYLEHARILIFANGGNERYYIGSADWMPRNLDNRIEVMTPVYNEAIQQDLKRIVDYGLQDTMQGRIVDGSGKNRIWPKAEGENPFRSQEALYNYYKNNKEKEE